MKLPIIRIEFEGECREKRRALGISIDIPGRTMCDAPAWLGADRDSEPGRVTGWGRHQLVITVSAWFATAQVGCRELLCGSSNDGFCEACSELGVKRS